MPELPEVTTITNQLKKEIVGSTITGVQVLGSYKTQPELPEFERRSLGLKVLSVRRIAKNIVVELKDLDPSGRIPLLESEPRSRRQDDEGGGKSFLVIHLAMTGRLLLRPLDSKPDPWTRLVFRLESTPVMLNSFQHLDSKIPKQVRDDTLSVRELRFCDSRMFGFVRLMNKDQLEQYASKYGPDALDENLTPQVFLSQLKKKRTEVKRAMLEQDLIAGAGNIYVNDSLWMAKIHPQTSTQELQETQAQDLLKALQTVLKESIGHRGSTLGDKMYIDVYGQEGEHQNYFRVFGKDGQVCPRCSTKIEFMEIGGRGTFFCPKCQVRTVHNRKNSLEDQVAML